MLCRYSQKPDIQSRERKEEDRPLYPPFRNAFINSNGWAFDRMREKISWGSYRTLITAPSGILLR